MKVYIFENPKKVDRVQCAIKVVSHLDSIHTPTFLSSTLKKMKYKRKTHKLNVFLLRSRIDLGRLPKV